jgi:predicted permease
VSHEIVGIAPAGFDFPRGAQLWIPWQLDPTECGRGCHSMSSIGRVADSTTIEALWSQLTTLAETLAAAHPETNTGKRFRAVRLADDQVDDVRGGLWFILCAVSLVLLIACANVANPLLVRGEGRRGEVAVRTALGASRAQLASQVLMESAVLAASGALMGLGLARAAITLVRAMPAGVPRIETVSLDATVLLFTLVLSVVVTLLFGLSPAIRQARGPAAADLISERRAGSAPRASRSRSLLLAGELALSVLLLVGAGLMLKSFDRLYRVDFGFRTDHLTRFNVSLPGTRYDSISDIVGFYETLEQRLAALPGVVSVASAFGVPLGSADINANVSFEGRPPAQPGAESSASIHSITSAYFATMRLSLLRGRGIEASDRTGTLPAAVVSQTFVAQNFPNEDPLGKRISVSADLGFGAPAWTIEGA